MKKICTFLGFLLLHSCVGQEVADRGNNRESHDNSGSRHENRRGHYDNGGDYDGDGDYDDGYDDERGWWPFR